MTDLSGVFGTRSKQPNPGWIHWKFKEEMKLPRL